MFCSFTEIYISFCQQEEVEPLVLIGAFVLDFLCIYPFNDGNGRMSRLFTLLLLYQSGFEVGRFISIEKIIRVFEKLKSEGKIEVIGKGRSARWKKLY